MMTAETGEPEREQWIANLDKVAALEPSLVIAGHKKADNGNDPKIIAESQQYLRDFSRIAAEETTTAGIVARMAGLFCRAGRSRPATPSSWAPRTGNPPDASGSRCQRG
jgi:hypothetical protein